MKFNLLSINKIFSIAFVLTSCVFLIALFIFTTTRPASAAPITDFNAGNIIDDAVFYNKNAMTASQIQDLLNRLMPNCYPYGQSPANGFNPPYVCLKDYYENPNTGETSFERGLGAFAGSISAAQIIYNAAQQYGINPQVLLVMLKKESAGPLTADTWPIKNQYKYAMGYGCPDSGGPENKALCDGNQAGFYKQVMKAAWQLNYYRQHPNDYRYHLGWNNIQYSPDTACGTKAVHIDNMATLSLYIYTPYTPNNGALSNYPGTAACGAYGNRNFYAFFKEWFGTTHSNIQVDMLQAASDINNVYNTHKTRLGNPLTNITLDLDGVVRVWQTFEHGVVIWTAPHVAYPVFEGSIYSRWRTLGGSAGTLGAPTSTAFVEADGRQWQSFQKGVIIHASTTGAWEVLAGPIGDTWRAAGGSLGSLGKPVSGVHVSSVMRKQSFEHGVVARKNTSSPAYTITGKIYTSWLNNQSLFGAPTSAATHELNDGRVWQNFARGVVIDNGSSAWFIETGPFYAKWRQLGGSLGELGKPLSNQVTESDGRVWQNFENGYLIQKKTGRDVQPVINGPIFDRWKTAGGSTGTLGVPTSTPVTESDGRVWQNFENGTIIWASVTGAWEVQGGFYTYWKSHGGSLGSLGKPTSARTIEPEDTRWQTFEHGKATWSPVDGWSIAWD